MSNVVLIPGIRTSDPMDTFAEVACDLELAGVDYKVADYGYILMPINNTRAERATKAVAQPGCVLVGYSNGGRVALKLAREVGARELILISPAARCDAPVADCVQRVVLFYSPGDWVNELGGAYSAAVSLMPWRWGTPHGFGRLGVDGPCQEDDRFNVREMPERIAHNWDESGKIVNDVSREIITAARRAKAYPPIKR